MIQKFSKKKQNVKKKSSKFLKNVEPEAIFCQIFCEQNKMLSRIFYKLPLYPSVSSLTESHY